MGDPVDYDSLAAQHGGTTAVDYDALAAQHGGVVHSGGAPASHDIKAAPKPFTAEWLKQKGYEAIDALANSLPGAGATIGATIGGGAGTAVEPGAGTAAGAVGGAGIGGMAGSAGKHIIRNAMGWEQPGTDVPKDIGKEGLIQGAMQATGEAAGLLAGPIKNAATTQYQRALAPTTKLNKSIVQDITPEMMDRGIHGTLPGIEEHAAAQADALRPQLDQAISAIPADKIKGTPWEVMSSLQKLKKGYMVDGKIADPDAVAAINKVQDVVGQYGDDISPESLRKLRQIFDNPVAKKAGFNGGDLSTQYGLEAKKQAADTIRGILNSASPDVARLNKEMSFWLDVQKVTQESGLRQTGQQGGLMKVLAPLAAATGGAAGFTHGGAAQGLEAAVGTAAATTLAVVMRTPAWRTTSALYKNSIADAVASGNAQRLGLLLSRFGKAASETAQEQRQTERTAEQ